MLFPLNSFKKFEQKSQFYQCHLYQVKPEHHSGNIFVTFSLLTEQLCVIWIHNLTNKNHFTFRENKNALGQLISHTKNVERAVTMNQQDLMARKEAQAVKLVSINENLPMQWKDWEERGERDQRVVIFEHFPCKNLVSIQIKMFKNRVVSKVIF